jgi:hypothetical protein
MKMADENYCQDPVSECKKRYENEELLSRVNTYLVLQENDGNQVMMESLKELITNEDVETLRFYKDIFESNKALTVDKQILGVLEQKINFLTECIKSKEKTPSEVGVSNQ